MDIKLFSWQNQHQRMISFYFYS